MISIEMRYFANKLRHDLNISVYLHLYAAEKTEMTELSSNTFSPDGGRVTGNSCCGTMSHLQVLIGGVGGGG